MNLVLIPFFNERNRFDFEILNYEFPEDLRVALLDDGSTDGLSAEIIEIVTRFGIDNIRVNRFDVNKGKSEVLRQGFLKAFNDTEINYQYIAFIDADFSTELPELIRLISIANEKDLDLVAGSRMKIVGRDIKTNYLRYLFGRFFAILIELLFNLGMYDTQCGAKVFKNSVYLQKAMEKPFINSWLFDIEIMLRLKENFKVKIWEEPLNKWHHKRHSKIRILSLFSIFFGLIRLKLRLKPTN